VVVAPPRPARQGRVHLPSRRAASVEPLSPSRTAQKPDGQGGIYFVDIIVKQPSFLERWFPASFHDGASIVPAEAVNPTA
jgi:hypothetical protein